jgi:hypothetical protein
MARILGHQIPKESFVYGELNSVYGFRVMPNGDFTIINTKSGQEELKGSLSDLVEPVTESASKRAATKKTLAKKVPAKKAPAKKVAGSKK